MSSNLKDSFKSIEELSDKKLFSTYEDWQKWLLTFRNLSKNTALSYGYDFKYFLNFLRLHYEENKVSLTILNNGIETRRFFWPMHKQKIFKKMKIFKNEKFPNSEFMSKNGFYIPSGINLKNKELRYITKTINRILK